MKFPSLHYRESLLRRSGVEVECRGVWFQARPVGYPSFWSRIGLAWGVLVGRYDALYWGGGQ